jgi:hypothetical protein
MKRDQIKVEVHNLNGEKVLISKDYNKMDLSVLADDIYLINYIDKQGYTFYREKILKKHGEEQFVVIG